jgi:glutathione S-transferase
MLRILGKRQSINVRKVLWACDEIGLNYAQEEWGAGTRSASDPEYLALNPKALVPVVIDDGEVLTESNTIVRYLAAKHGRTDLLPLDALARARVEEMMDWQATELNWSWRAAFQAIVRKNPGAGTAEQVRKSREEWSAMMQLLERRLAGAAPYVCGKTFTAADIVIGLSVNRWFQTPMERSNMPLARLYLERLMQRPAAKRHLGGNTD